MSLSFFAALLSSDSAVLTNCICSTFVSLAQDRLRIRWGCQGPPDLLEPILSAARMKLQVLPALVAILVLLSTPSSGTLESFLDTYIGPISQGPVLENFLWIDWAPRTREYIHLADVYVGEHNEAFVLYVAPNMNDLVPETSDESNYLPYNPNMATYLSLDQDIRGGWFFTAMLSGCEIWIATTSWKEPVMLHVNTPHCQYTVGDLEERENMAVNTLNLINAEVGHVYSFVYRLMGPRDDIKDYLDAFHDRYPNVIVGAYGADDGGIFYGQYPPKGASDNTIVYGGWSFRCKNGYDGTLFDIGINIATTENIADAFCTTDTCKSMTDTERIENEIRNQISKGTCAEKIKATQVAEGLYEFGDAQTQHSVRIFRNAVIVSVEGSQGWESLDVFLHERDPCRA